MNPETFMLRAHELAHLGMENVSPNPMVGCVIVHDDKIIGEGYHTNYGGPHAEVNAINNVKDKSLLAGSTLYVNLEPCCHQGKTPPCADLILKYGIKQVHISNVDPNLKVAGKGIALLEKNGVKVELGILKDEGEILNKRFFKVHKTELPYIILKWAETADGFIAALDKKPLKISNSMANITVHRWRAEEDATLIGAETLKTDNPKLNVRHWPSGKKNKRVILANSLDFDQNLKVFDQSLDTLIFNSEMNKNTNNLEFIKYPDSILNLEFVLKTLIEKGINSVLVEGGAKTHELFIKNGFYDEIRIIKSTQKLKEGISAAKVPSGIALTERYMCMDNEISIYCK